MPHEDSYCQPAYCLREGLSQCKRLNVKYLTINNLNLIQCEDKIRFLENHLIYL
jgi:hypothetical protein